MGELFAGWRFALPAWLVTTAYIYVLYAWLCGSWLLLSPWDFFGHPRWPPAVLLTRNAAILFFFASACFLIAREIAGLFGARSARRSL